MAWTVLIASGVLESVWATALSRSEGFTRIAPTIVFVIALVLSMAGLAHALRTIPIGTGYAVWVGIGAALTAAIAIATGQEPVSIAKVALLLVLIASIVGLRLVQS